MMYSLRLIQSAIVILIALNVGAENAEREPPTKAFVVKWTPLVVMTRYPYGKADVLRTHDYEYASDDVSPDLLSTMVDKVKSVQSEQSGVLNDGGLINLRVICWIVVDSEKTVEIGIGQFPEKGIYFDGRIYQSESQWFIERIENIVGRDLNSGKQIKN
jgi:hypothetical protein